VKLNKKCPKARQLSFLVILQVNPNAGQANKTKTKKNWGFLIESFLLDANEKAIAEWQPLSLR
jgi:hypothetical protein